MASIYVRFNKIWGRIKDRDGKWRSIRTPYSVGHEKEARAAIERVQEQHNAESAVAPGHAGPLTLRLYGAMWLERRKREVESWDNDESRLRLYIYPELGDLPLSDVRPRHIRDFIGRLRQREKRPTKKKNDKEKKGKKLASRTVHNTYAVLSALFRDAAVDGLIENTPCILKSAHLGPKVDADPDWRPHALYTREELIALVSDPRIDIDRRVLWALMGIAGLRAGEAFGLTFARIDWSASPLAAIRVVTSHDKGRTKTNVNRVVPVHPTLHRILRSWTNGGWEQVMGREPKSDDLVVPLPASRFGPAGRMRSNNRTLKQLHADLDLLGAGHRRVHDLRRTMISLSRSDGASKDILGRVTHQPPKEVIEGYTSFEWDVVCREVGKLRLDITEREHGAPAAASTTTAPLHDLGAGPRTSELSEGILATALATVGPQKQRSPGNLSASGASFLRGVGDLNP